jgi:hypothetical protein
LWCQALHGHRRWGVTPFGLSVCQEENKCISDYDYSLGVLYPQQSTYLRPRWPQAM